MFFSTPAFTQLDEKDQSMSEGVQNALVIELNGSDKKRAEKIWRSYAKSFGKVEYNRRAKEFLVKEATVPAVQADSILSIYTKFDEYDDMTRAFFWVKKDEQFISSSSHSDATDGISAVLSEYMIQVEKEVVKDELKEEEKELKKLQKELEKLEKRNKDLHKDIEKARENIRKAESEIERNILEQADKKIQIEEQVKAVSEVSDKMNKVGKN